MKRLLQFATIFFIASALMPLWECFDRWDLPGLADDTELPTFFIILLIALVLISILTMARHFFDVQSHFAIPEILYETQWNVTPSTRLTAFDPFIIPPLRI